MSKKQFHSRYRLGISPKRVLGAIVAVLVAFFLSLSVFGLAKKYIAIRSRLRNLKEEHATLLQKQETLQKTNDYLSTPEGQEEALREKYNVVKPGEGVVVITTPPGAENGDHTSRIAKWWDSLLHGLGVRK